MSDTENALKSLISQTCHSARTHPLLVRFPVAKEFTKFIMVGFLNTGLDFIIYLTLSREIDFFKDHLLSANIIAFAVAATNSFFLNKFWTFRDKKQELKTQYSKFFAVSTGGLIITQMIFVAGVHYLHIFDIFVKLTAVIIVTFWNFALNKWWTFKKI